MSLLLSYYTNLDYINLLDLPKLIFSSVQFSSVAQSCPTLCDPVGLSPRDSPGKNTGGGCRALLQGIFPIQDHSCVSLTSPALGGGLFTTSAIWDAKCLCFFHLTGAVLPLHFLLGSQHSPTERKDETLLKGKKKWAPKMMLFPGFGMSQT